MSTAIDLKFYSFFIHIVMKTKTQRGFSLIESVVSIAIGLSVAVVLIAVVVAGLREVRVVSAASDMQTNVIFVGESLARLVQESRIIAVDTGNPERLTITLPDNSVHVVEKVDGQIMLDGTPITSNDVTVTNLVFTLFPTAGPI